MVAVRPPTVAGYSDFVEIGRGGSSTVYSAVEAGLGRRVAIKVLDVDLSDSSTRRRFDRECAALGALTDAPGIVPVHAVATTEDGRGCIVMRLMTESMSQRLRRSGPIPTALVHHTAIVIAEALAYAHELNICHRDIKPANLLISEHGEIALTDFDIASVGSTPLSTQTNDAMSPAHASPERLAGQRDVGISSDVWSFGSTMFTLLEGRAPFGTAQSPGGMAGLVRRVMTEPLPPLNRDDVPPEFEAIIRRAMAKEPGDRWPSASAIVEALAAVPAGSGRPPQWNSQPAGGTSPEIARERLDHKLRHGRAFSPVVVAVGAAFAGVAVTLAIMVFG